MGDRDRMPLTVVGLDGASPNVFERWLDDLPTLRSLIGDGFSGTLKSTDPPVTNVAWTSFATGKRPETTEVFDWVYIDEDYRPRTYRGDEVRQRALYDLVPGSTYVNLPAVYPREPTAEGADVVYAFDAPDSTVALPAGFRGWPEADDYVSGKPDDDLAPIDQIRRMREIEAARFALAKRAFRETDELFYVLFSSTDFGLHTIQELDGAIAEEFRELYRDIDGYIQWFRERSDDLVVMSDHGFEEKTRQVFVSEWLREQGYLRLADPAATGGDGALLRRLVPAAVLDNDVLYGLGRRVLGALDAVAGADGSRGVYEAFAEADFDYGATQVFKDGGLWNLVVNYEDVFEEGCVPRDEASDLLEAVVDGLAALEDPATGRPVFEDVRVASEARRAHPRAPDVVLEPTAGVSVAGRSMRRRVFDDTQTHAHRKDGFVVAAGDSFTAGEGEASIVDVAPTLLHVLGRPVPEDCDGAVIREALAAPGDVAVGPPAVLDGPPPTRDGGGDDDEAVLQRRLEELGYM